MIALPPIQALASASPLAGNIVPRLPDVPPESMPMSSPVPEVSPGTELLQVAADSSSPAPSLEHLGGLLQKLGDHKAPTTLHTVGDAKTPGQSGTAGAEHSSFPEMLDSLRALYESTVHVRLVSKMVTESVSAINQLSKGQ